MAVKPWQSFLSRKLLFAEVPVRSLRENAAAAFRVEAATDHRITHRRNVTDEETQEERKSTKLLPSVGEGLDFLQTCRPMQDQHAADEATVIGVMEVEELGTED